MNTQERESVTHFKPLKGPRSGERSLADVPLDAGRKLNILVDLNMAFVFDRRAFAGIAESALAKGVVRLAHRMNEADWSDALADRHIDGVIASRLSDEQQQELVRIGLPFATFMDTPHEAASRYVIGMDEQAIGVTAAKYFLEANFQNFVVFARPNVRRYFYTRIGSFCETVRAAGFDCVIGPPPPEAWSTRTTADVDDENGWEEDADEWLSSLAKPLAVFAPNDSYAQVAMISGRLANLRCPEDLAIIGVDDDDVYCLTTSPQLSSIITPARQIGQRALELLVDAINGKNNVPRRVLFEPAGIVLRGSTSDFALQDNDVIAAVRFIREHAAKHVTVSMVAEHVLLSRRTLERRFMQTLSHTIQDEIRRAKIHKAKRLLIDTDLCFAEVARMSGLNQQSQLNRLIKLATTKTPKQYREAAREYRRV